jgi:hypothetical protein
MSIFSSSVIWLSSESTRRSTAADDTAGAEVCAGPETTFRQRSDRTAIAEQRFRMAFQSPLPQSWLLTPNGGRADNPFVLLWNKNPLRRRKLYDAALLWSIFFAL